MVALPLIVSPPTPVPSPIVLDAFERNPARRGLPENTKLPADPVSSVMSDASSAEVSIEDEETLSLKIVQSAEVRHPNVELFEVIQVRAFELFWSPLPVRSVKYSLFVPRVVA